jgi:hypothetical protein
VTVKDPAPDVWVDVRKTWYVGWWIVRPVPAGVMETPQPMLPVSPHTLAMVIRKPTVDPLAREALVGDIVRVKSLLHAAFAASGYAEREPRERMMRLVDRSSRTPVLPLFILVRNIHLSRAIAIVGYDVDSTLFNAISIVG